MGDKEDALLLKVARFAETASKEDMTSSSSMPGLNELIADVVNSGLLSKQMEENFLKLVRNLEFGRVTSVLAVIAILAGNNKQAEEEGAQLEVIASKIETHATTIRAHAYSRSAVP